MVENCPLNGWRPEDWHGILELLTDDGIPGSPATSVRGWRDRNTLSISATWGILESSSSWKPPSPSPCGLRAQSAN